MSFVGGKLKLKGGSDLKVVGPGGVKKKKKKNKAAADGDAATALVAAGGAAADGDADGEASRKAALEGYVPAPPPEGADRRTEAEKRREERVRKLEEEQLRKLAAKGYRDRLKDFNAHLATLSEHHDIPKVGPG